MGSTVSTAFGRRQYPDFTSLHDSKPTFDADSGFSQERRHKEENGLWRIDRHTYTQHQTLELEKEFRSNQYLTRRRRIEMARSLCLTERQIKAWFQKRWIKMKKKIQLMKELQEQEKSAAAVAQEKDEQEVSLYEIPWQPCKCRKCSRWFQKPSNLVKHYRSAHARYKISFVCQKCQRSSRNPHSALCHYSKCGGVVDEELPHVCGGCARGFKTLSGMRQHQRHQHFAQRLVARAGEPRARSGRTLNVWTEDEVRIVLDFMRGVTSRAGLKHYDQRLHDTIPEKSCVQIREKVRGLRDTGRLPRPNELPAESFDEEVIGEIYWLRGKLSEGPKVSPTYESSAEVFNEVITLHDWLGSGNTSGIQLPKDVTPPGHAGDVTDHMDDTRIVPKADSVVILQKDTCQLPDFLHTTLELPYCGEDVCIVWRQEDHLNPLAQELAEMIGITTRLRPEWIDNFVMRVTSEVLSSVQPTVGEPRSSSTTIQELFENCPARLAELVRSDSLTSFRSEDEALTLPKEQLIQYYQDLWGVTGICRMKFTRAVPQTGIAPITAIEVKQRIMKLKTGGAPDVDGVTKPMLLVMKGCSDLLAGLFNALLSMNHYPPAWKRYTACFIPQEGEDLSSVAGWKPITGSSVFARVFSGIICRRIRKMVKLSTRQVGFVQGNGIFLNVAALDQSIRLGKESRICGAMLDITKAFDSVSHEALLGALEAQGVARPYVDLVRNMYQDSSTSLENCGGAVVALRRGVKQGDPLSSTLFNIVVDPLLRALERTKYGFVYGCHRLACLAYDDDLVLLAEEPHGLQQQLNVTSAFLETIGLRLSISKCVGFRIARKGKAWVVPPLEVSIAGEPIRNLGPVEPFRYLGAHFTLAGGLTNGAKCEQVLEAARRVNALNLKPNQKQALIFKHVLPAYLHLFFTDLLSKNKLRAIDSSLRLLVKDIFHLPLSTSDGLFYSRKKDGGLGTPRLYDVVRAAHLKALLTVLARNDMAMKELILGSNDARARCVAEDMSLQWPTSPEKIKVWKKARKDREHIEWDAQSYQGKGVALFRNNKFANAWLLGDELTPEELIDLLKMRSNVFPVRISIARAEEGDSDTMCRRCHAKPETLGHVLGECPVGSGARIQRHNHVVALVARKTCDSGWTVASEQLFEGADRTLRPDLVVKTDDKAWIVDVTVRFEQDQSLAEASREKKTKYAVITDAVKIAMGVQSVKVLPLVFGSRGALPKDTIKNLAKLGISQPVQLKTVITGILRSSIYIARAHLDTA